jgi:drug/metabolite transporter (DMT)-like permease
MWFAARAHVNVGVIVCMWSLNPLFMAVLDFFIIGQQLEFYHIFGTIALVLCALSISLSD